MIEDIKLKFGVMIFDNEECAESGWASIDGAPATRVEGTNMLSTSAIWLTNLNWEAFNLKNKMGAIARLRQVDYFPLAPVQIMKEWNRDPTSPPDYTATFCSQIFSRIMNIVFKLAVACKPDLKMKDFFIHNSLKEDIRTLLPEFNYPKDEAATVLQAGSAFAHFTKTLIPIPKGSCMIKLIKPRLSYATDLLTSPVPEGDFRFMSRMDLRRETSDRVSWIYDNHCPVFAEIGIENSNADLSKIYNFDSSTDSNKKTIRSWVAHPEFVALSSFSKINVNNAYIGDKYTTIGQQLPEPIQNFLNTQFSDISWSAGLIAETIWKAIIMPKPKGKLTPKNEKPPLSWQGLWLRAIDKALMFAPAMHLQDMNYNVISYANGWIQVYIQEEQRNDIIRDALSLGLIPLMYDVPDNSFVTNREVKDIWGGDERALGGIVAQNMQKKADILWNLDKVPLYDASQQKDVLTDIIKASKNKKI